MTGVIDLSRLPAPDVVREVDYEHILSELKNDLGSKNDAIKEALLYESEPLVQLLETFAYREMLLRAFVNDSARECMVATATGTNLDHLGVFYGVNRGVVVEADDTASPPIVEVKEDDETFRQRILLAPEGLSVAGSGAAYIYQALSLGNEPSSVVVSSDSPGEINVRYRFENSDFVKSIKDASVYSPGLGEVTVVILGREGEVDDDTIKAVADHLSGETVRPLTDLVKVEKAKIATYDVKATLYLYKGPDAEIVRANAMSELEKYAEDRYVLDGKISESGIYASLQVPGVSHVVLDDFVSPTNNKRTAPFLKTATINVEILGVVENKSFGPQFDKETDTVEFDEHTIYDRNQNKSVLVNGLTHADREEMILFLTGEDSKDFLVTPQKFDPKSKTVPKITFVGTFDFEKKRTYEFTLNAIDFLGAKASQVWTVRVADIEGFRDVTPPLETK